MKHAVHMCICLLYYVSCNLFIYDAITEMSVAQLDRVPSNCRMIVINELKEKLTLEF
jgi:hypothetical protein